MYCCLLLVRLFLAFATFPGGGKTITANSVFELISGESYIIVIWKLFSHRKSLSDVQQENKFNRVAALPGIHSDLIPSALKRLKERGRK